jgi:hypothetical protein
MDIWILEYWSSRDLKWRQYFGWNGLAINQSMSVIKETIKWALEQGGDGSQFRVRHTETGNIIPGDLL